MTTTTHETHEVGQGSVTLAVVVEGSRLVVVLRARAQPDVVVRVPITHRDAADLTRALAGSLRYLAPADGCPACDLREIHP